MNRDKIHIVPEFCPMARLMTGITLLTCIFLTGFPVKSETTATNVATNRMTSSGGGKPELLFSHQRNFYSDSFELEITTNPPGATIIYTADCSVPTVKNGIVYSGRILVDSTTVIKAMAFQGTDTSRIVTQSYLFIGSVLNQAARPAGFPATWGGSKIIAADYAMDPRVISQPSGRAEAILALQSLPAVSLSMTVDDWFNPAAGLYVGYPNTQISREKVVTAEFIFREPGQNFAVGCGVQNQGGTSIVDWKVPKQSMRLLFKDIYGPGKLNCRLFHDSAIDSINTLVLDGFLYSWLHPWDDTQRKTTLYFRDQLCSDLQNKMGWPSYHGRYVNLFINGLYWGMYDLHERPDDAFLAWYLKGSRDDFDIIRHNANDVVQGSNQSYLDMLMVARSGVGNEPGLIRLKKYLDLPAFIDYMILNFYLGNYDWAHHNYYAATNSVLNTGFRFYTWDAEHVMRYSDVNYDNTGKNDKGGPTEIHTLLRQNDEYRMMFADAVYRHLFNDGVLTPDSFAACFLYRKNEIDKAVVLESARWGDFLEKSTGVAYSKYTHWLPEVDKVLSEYIPQRRDIVIRQFQNLSNRLFPSVMPPVFSEKSGSGSTIEVTMVNPNNSPGEIYFTTDGSDPRLKGGAIRGSKYSGPVIAGKTTIIKARFRSGRDGTWSALAEKDYFFDDKYGEDIMISEIMYHPDDGCPEFVELMNSGSVPLNLKGFSLTGGIEFYFGEDLLVNPGSGIVLSNDTLLFRKVYRFNASGQYLKKLDNNTETLIMVNRFNQVVDSVSYKSVFPWPEIPGGEGYSIEMKEAGLDNSAGSNWRVSSKEWGDPFDPGEKIVFEAGLYPNPVTGNATVFLNNSALGFSRFLIEVFNQTGSLVKKMEKDSYNQELSLDLADIGPGFYLIRITPVTEKLYKGLILKAVKVR